MTRPARNCSSRSRRCRNIIRRAASSRSCASARADIARFVPRGVGADRVRQRLEQEGADPARGGADDRRLCAGRHFLRDARRRRRQELRRDYPRLAVLPVEADFTKPFALPAAVAGMRARRIFPGLDHRQFRAARSLLVPAPCRPHAGPRRDPDHRRRPGEGRRASSMPPTTTRPASPRSSISICSRASTASSTATSISQASATRPSTIPSATASRCISPARSARR